MIADCGDVVTVEPLLAAVVVLFGFLLLCHMVVLMDIQRQRERRRRRRQ